MTQDSTILITPDNRAPAEWLANAFRKVDWLIPPYRALGFINLIAGAIENAPVENRPAILRAALMFTYTPQSLASMYLDRYRTIRHVRDFSRQIDEAIKAYFSGYKTAAVTTMIPVLEGIVRKMATQQGREIGSGTAKLVNEFEELIKREENSSSPFGERLVMLEALRDFIRDRFLEKTSAYDGQDEFNRHGILHGIFGRYGEDVNFFRAITLLDSLCFAMCMTEGGSLFHPPETPESIKLAGHYVELHRKSASAIH